MRSKARIGVVVALVSASAACSLLTDTSDLSGGARVGDSGIAVDGGEGLVGDAAKLDATTEDTGADVVQSDTFVPSDAKADAPDAATCVPGVMALCDGFERTTLVGPWDGKTTGGGGSIDLASDGQRGFLRATSPGASGLADVDAELYKDFTQATAVYYDYDFRYSALPVFGAVEMQTVYFQKQTGYSEVFLRLGPSGVEAYEQQGGSGAGSPLTISPGVWHRVSFEIHVGGALLVKVDGNIAVSKMLSSFITAGPVSVSAGIVYGSRPPTALTVDIDNVAFHATP
jgi:hypothetical protein